MSEAPQGGPEQGANAGTARDEGAGTGVGAAQGPTSGTAQDAPPAQGSAPAGPAPERAAAREADPRGAAPQDRWPLYEVFVRGKRGLNHVHVGSLHAADDAMALTHARDLYTRRNEGVSIWVVRSSHIAASTRDEKDPFFAPSADKVYRHPTFYDIPADVPHI